MIRVRYAPSPTGFLHIGNARTALFNYLYAKKYEGSFIVRIEDTDTERNVETGIENQLHMLKWLGIDWDESIDKPGNFGPYQQLKRLDLYQKYANVLLEKGLAYKCYCTKEELEAEKAEQIARGDHLLHYSRKCLSVPDQDKPFAIRFKVSENQTYTFNDIVKGEVTFKSEDVGDWVMVKQNGIPTYNFACVVDDHLMEISHVLRGEDHITNTPRQMMVYKALDWEAPIFGHMTLIVNHQGKKLSKRDADIIQFIEQYKDLGYLPEALFNFVSLLGFSPGEEEILSPSELIEAFDQTKLSNHPATFDPDKLKYINSQYMKKRSLEDLKILTKPFLDHSDILNGKDDAYLESLVAVFKDRLEYGAQILDLYHEFLEKPFIWDDEMTELMKSEGVSDLLKALYDGFNQLNDWTPESIKTVINESGIQTSSKGKMLFMPSRIAVSASMHGPELPKLIHLFDKNSILTRIKQSLTWLGF
jgi:nondiscriminating glutamyl-tRNA synthetase